MCLKLTKSRCWKGVLKPQTCALNSYRRVDLQSQQPCVKATNMRTKGDSDRKVELKSQQPWTAVSAMLGLISIAQLVPELWVATW